MTRIDHNPASASRRGQDPRNTASGPGAPRPWEARTLNEAGRLIKPDGQRGAVIPRRRALPSRGPLLRGHPFIVGRYTGGRWTIRIGRPS